MGKLFYMDSSHCRLMRGVIAASQKQLEFGQWLGADHPSNPDTRYVTLVDCCDCHFS
jgi:hypothetical protein